jgi:tetratricopeptide (TPR) repeat protein
MRWHYNRGWHPSRWWELKVQNWSARKLQSLNPSPDAGLRGSQAVLRHAIRRGGPDSPRAANAMVQVADQLRRQERYSEELLLREQIVETLRKNLGENHISTLSAELQTGVCLVNLDREEDAGPLLTHVVTEDENSGDSVSTDSADAMVWLSVVHTRRGRLDEARELLERVLLEYALHGQAESTAELRTTSLLAAFLMKLDELDEATQLYRHVLDVSSRRLGPDDPDTLRFLQSLAKALVQTDHLAET